MSGIKRYQVACQYTETGFPEAYVMEIPNGEFVDYDDHAAAIAANAAELDRLRAENEALRKENAYLNELVITMSAGSK